MFPESDHLIFFARERDRRKYHEMLTAYNHLQTKLEELRRKLQASEEEAHALAVQLSALRRRMESDRATARDLGVIQAIRAILPVLDDMDRLAFHAEVSTDTQAVLDGFRLIHENLLGALESLGVRPISSVGSLFDPNVHEAVDRMESEAYPENTIAEELQKAYHFKGTLIRPAKVRVTVKPSTVRENSE